jgi:hypothetical protein
LHTEPISILAKESLVLIFYQFLFFQTIPLCLGLIQRS